MGPLVFEIALTIYLLKALNRKKSTYPDCFNAPND